MQGNREPIVEGLLKTGVVDLREILADLKLPPVPELLDDSDVIQEPEMAAVQPRADAAPKEEVRRGRPSKEDKIREAIDILLKRGLDLAKLPRPEAMAAIKKCAADELKSDVNIGFSEPVLQRILSRRFGPRG